MWTVQRSLTLSMLLVLVVSRCQPVPPLGLDQVATSQIPEIDSHSWQTAVGLYAFADVNVLTLENEQVLWRQTVLVDHQRIVALGPVDQVAIPPEAIVIPSAGQFLLPGLADMHIHLRQEYHLLLLLANGVTTVRNMDGRPEHLTWRAQIAAGERLGPTIFTTGPIMDEPHYGLPAPRPLSTWAGARQSVAEQQQLGYDYLKVYDGLSGSTYQNVVRAAREYNLPVVGHVPDRLRALDVIEAGQRSIEHLDGYFNFYDDQLPAFLAALVEHEVWSTPVLTCFQLLTPTGEPPSPFQQAMLTAIPDITTEFWQLPSDFAETGYAYAPISESKRDLVAQLQAAGAPLLLGTDAPVPYALPGFAVHQELQNLVEAGLTPYEALRIATYNAASFVNQPDVFGTVTVGKRADLLLVNANPLEDIANVRQIVGVMAQGRWLPQEELVDLLRQAAAERQAGVRMDD